MFETKVECFGIKKWFFPQGASAPKIVWERFGSEEEARKQFNVILPSDDCPIIVLMRETFSKDGAVLERKRIDSKDIFGN